MPGSSELRLECSGGAPRRTTTCGEMWLFLQREPAMIGRPIYRMALIRRPSHVKNSAVLKTTHRNESVSRRRGKAGRNIDSLGKDPPL